VSLNKESFLGSVVVLVEGVRVFAGLWFSQPAAVLLAAAASPMKMTLNKYVNEASEV